MEYLRTLFLQPVESALYRPHLSTTELVTVVVTISKLLLLQNVQGWDAAKARRTFDFSAIMARLIDKLAQAGETDRQRRGDAPGDHDSVFDRYGAKFGAMKNWFDAMLARESSAIPGAATVPLCFPTLKLSRDSTTNSGQG